MMPTTRKGRYLFFRARQRRRLSRAENRRVYFPMDADQDSGRVTTRALDLTAFDKQEPRVYPKHPALMHAPGAWKHRFTTPPSFGVFGVIPDPFGPPAGWGGINHRRFGVTRYYFRRLKSIPRLKKIPVEPYRLPLLLVPPREFYPFPIYPSGRVNPRWWRERF